MLFRPCYGARGVASIPCIDLTPQSCPLCKIMELISVTLPIAVLTLACKLRKLYWSCVAGGNQHARAREFAIFSHRLERVDASCEPEPSQAKRLQRLSKLLLILRKQ